MYFNSIKRRAFLFLALILALLLLSMPVIAATTVIPVEGISVTDSKGTGTVSNSIVTITATGSLFSKTTNTITIKNTLETAAQVSFDYSTTNANSCTVAGANSTSGSYSGNLDPDGTVTIVLKSNSGLSNLTATLTLKNFSITAAAESSDVTINFDNSLGTVTAGGVSVSDGTVVGDVTSSGLALVASVNSGTTFLGWVDGTSHQLLSTATSYTLAPMADMTVEAAFSSSTTAGWFMCVNGANNYLFNDLDEAATYAKSISDKRVILAANGTLSGSYTIPSGVTLLIPFDTSNTLYTTAPGTAESYTTPSVYRTLTMASGASITVNGAISVSAKQCAVKDRNGYVCGPYGKIAMDSGSSISIENGGFLYAWGYITGSGSVAVKSGGTVYEDFQLADFRGGDGTSKMASNTYGVFPMSQYYLQNVEVPMTLYSGAVEKGYLSFKITLIGVQTTTVPVLSNGDSSMFKVSSGYIVKDYIEGTGRIEFKICGDVALNSLSITMKLGVLGSTTINSEDFNLPIPGHFTVDAQSGNLSINQDLAFLPGSELYIRKGVTATLGSGVKVFIYDWADWSGYCGSSNKKYFALSYVPGGGGTTGREKAAQFQVDGRVDASAGAVYVTAAGANIYSTGGGVIVAPATDNAITHQATQATVNSSQELTYVEINVQSPILRDGIENSSIQATAAGTYTYYSDTKLWCPPGHRYSEKVIAPTCTETGYTEHTCAACGNTYTDNEVAALGHDEINHAAQAPTCTEIGWDAYVTCSRCDYTTYAEKSALGHSYESVVTAPTCTEAGYTTYTCSACGDSYKADEVAALGHTYSSSVDKNTYMITYTCVCGDSYSEPCIVLSSMECYYRDEVVLRLKFTVNDASLLEKLKFTMSMEGRFGTKTVTYTASEMTPGEKGRYVVDLGVASGEMTRDIITSVTDADGNPIIFYKNSETIIGSTYTTSVQKYVMGVLTSSLPDANKKAAAALAVYGGYAQLYFGYETENLAYSLDGITLPDLSDVTAESLSQYNHKKDGTVTGITIKSYETYLDSNLFMRFRFALDADANIDDYTFTLTDASRNQHALEPVYEESSGRYYVDTTGIPAAHLDNAYTVTVTKGNETMSIQASVLSWIRAVLQQSQNDAQKNMVKALYYYSQACTELFGQ